MDAHTSAIFSFLTGNTLFGQIWSKKKKNQNCQCKLKFSTKANSNTQNSMVMFSFFVFDWEYSFWANLAQQIKIVSLS